MKEFIDLLACPACFGSVTPLYVESTIKVLCCISCRLIYPIKDGIPILLPPDERNYHLEYDLILANEKNICSHGLDDSYIKNTLGLLEESRKNQSWAWEDEKFWSKEYASWNEGRVSKNWNDRIWQREFLTRKLFETTSLDEKIILDCGAGEGQNFRFLLADHCTANTVYIAADISYDGLCRNRSLNKHKRSYYILCTVDRLPFKAGRLDVLCYFGILHHTKRKASAIPGSTIFMRKDGYVLLHEPVFRPSVIPRFLKSQRNESAHEERIFENDLKQSLGASRDLDIVLSKQINSLLYYASMRLFGKAMKKSRLLFQSISRLDQFAMLCLSKIIKHFKPSDVLLLLRKT